MERSGPKALEKLNTADHVSSSGTSSQPSSGRHHGAHSRSGCSFTATPQNSTKLSALSLSPATSAASHTKSRTSSGSTSTIMSLHGLQSAPMANERQFLIALDTAPKCATVEDDNDRIVQERLLEAKALERKNVSGAVMHQFSLWNKAQPAATKLNDPEEAGTLSPRITTNKLCSMSSSQCTVSETANSGNGSHKKPSKLRGPKAAREVHHSLQEEEPRGLAPSATAQQQHHHHLLQQQQHQHQQQHKPTSPSSGKKTCGGVFPTTAGGTPCEESKTATNTSMDGEALDGDYTMEFEAIDDENAKQASATENIPSFSASGSLAAALRMKVGSAKHSLPSTGSDGSLGSESKQHVYSTPEKSTTSPSALTSFDRSKERAAVAVALAFESGEQQAESDGGWNSDEDLVEEDEELQRLSANRPRSAGGNDSAAADLEADLAVSAAIKSMSQSGPAAFATQPARRALLGDYTGGNGNSNTAGVQEDISTSKLAMRRATTSGDNRHFVDKFEHLISTAAAAGGSGGGGGGGGLGTESNQSLKSMTSRSASECNISFEPSELHSQSAKSSSTKYQVLRNLRSNKSSQKNLDRMELSAQFHLSMMEAEAQEEGQNKSSNSNCNDDAPPPTAAAAAASFSVVQPSLASSHGIPSEEYEQGVLAPDREEEDAPSPTLSEFSDAEEPLELHQEQQRQRQALSPLRVEIAGEAQTLEALRERTSSADRNQIDLEDGEDSPLRWRKGEVIGEGTFGKVYKGMNEKTGELLAIKQLCMVDGTSVEVDSLCKEISVMWNLEHENIVRYFIFVLPFKFQCSFVMLIFLYYVCCRYMGTSKTERYLYIILEYVTGGSIAGMITQFGPFNEKLMRCRKH